MGTSQAVKECPVGIGVCNHYFFLQIHIRRLSYPPKFCIVYWLIRKLSAKLNSLVLKQNQTLFFYNVLTQLVSFDIEG